MPARPGLCHTPPMCHKCPQKFQVPFYRGRRSPHFPSKGGAGTLNLDSQTIEMDTTPMTQQCHSRSHTPCLILRSTTEPPSLMSLSTLYPGAPRASRSVCTHGTHTSQQGTRPPRSYMQCCVPRNPETLLLPPKRFIVKPAKN